MAIILSNQSKTMAKTNHFLDGFFSVFFSFLETENTMSKNQPAIQKNNLTQSLKQLKIKYENTLIEDAKFETLNNHTSLKLKIINIFDCLNVELDDFSVASLSIRLISLKVTFERESEIMPLLLRTNIKTLILETKEFEQFMQSSSLPQDIRDGMLQKAPKARGSVSVYDETQAYMRDEMRQRSLKVLSP